MLTLLTPSALLALLGLLVPVAIHLWNRRPGREVAVGSLRWLTAGANRRLRNLRPEQLPLLLLRAGLLAVLAVALAGPVWRQAVPAGRGQALVSAQLVGTPAFATLRPTLDSLRRRGYALRWLAPGFPLMPLAAWRSDSLGQQPGAREASKPNSAPEAFTWARVRQAAEAFPGQPLYVVTAAALREFQGPRPLLAGPITWRVLPVAPTTWPQAAASDGADSLRLLLGQSRTTQTTFRVVSVAKPRPGAVIQVAGLAPLRYEETRAGGALLRLLVEATSTAAPTSTAASVVPVRRRALRAVIYATAPYAADARALHAALRAAALGLPVPLALTRVASPPSPNDQVDWLFWLSDAPLPVAWASSVRKGTNIWQEAPAPGIADTAHLLSPAAAEPPVTIWRRDQASQEVQPSAAGDSFWTDGLGRPVLSRQVLGRGIYYRLHTRLNSPWSELADYPALPAQLLALLQPNPEWVGTNELASALSWDQRVLDPTQLPTARPLKNSAHTSAPVTFHLTDLRPLFVLAAGLLFAVERLLARRRVTQLTPTTP